MFYYCTAVLFFFLNMNIHSECIHKYTYIYNTLEYDKKKKLTLKGGVDLCAAVRDALHAAFEVSHLGFHALHVLRHLADGVSRADELVVVLVHEHLHVRVELFHLSDLLDISCYTVRGKQERQEREAGGGGYSVRR